MGYEEFSNRLNILIPLLHLKTVTATTPASNDASDSPQSTTNVDIVTLVSSVGGTVIVLLLALCLVAHIRKRRKQRVGDGTTEIELSNVTNKTSVESNSTFSNGAFVASKVCLS